jgi:anhydro-N-acetylmuramic acid kinase
MSARLVIGAMSGTSADGVDAALVHIVGHGHEMRPTLRLHLHRAYSPQFRRRIFAVRQAGAVALAELATLGCEISLAYADAVNDLLRDASVSPVDVHAIAAHGQTLFHNPPNTIQWLDSALLAARTGCRVVSDFRRADCAAGGQGAPLVPFADYILFRETKRSRVLLNLGGIANLTWLAAGASLDRLIAFDTGPANCISDHLMRRDDPAGPGFDANGALAAIGRPIDRIVRSVLSDAWFAQPPPKSTDAPAMIALFDAAVDRAGAANAPLPDLLATACSITAASILSAIDRWLPDRPDELIVSGGGCDNPQIMRLLCAARCPVIRSDDLGVPSSAKEAIAFALLGAATLDGAPSNVPTATGAARAVVLGSITPAQ